MVRVETWFTRTWQMFVAYIIYACMENKEKWGTVFQIVECPFKVPFAPLWHPFDIPLTSILGPFGSLWSPFDVPLTSLWRPFDVPLTSLWHLFDVTYVFGQNIPISRYQSQFNYSFCKQLSCLHFLGLGTNDKFCIIILPIKVNWSK